MHSGSPIWLRRNIARRPSSQPCRELWDAYLQWDHSTRNTSDLQARQRRLTKQDIGLVWSLREHGADLPRVACCDEHCTWLETDRMRRTGEENTIAATRSSEVVRLNRKLLLSRSRVLRSRATFLASCGVTHGGRCGEVFQLGAQRYLWPLTLTV